MCDGCDELRTFAQIYTAEIVGNPTPGNALLDQILAHLAEAGSHWGNGGDFGEALAFLDHNQAGYTTYVQVAIANALELATA